MMQVNLKQSISSNEFLPSHGRIKLSIIIKCVLLFWAMLQIQGHNRYPGWSRKELDVCTWSFSLRQSLDAGSIQLFMSAGISCSLSERVSWDEWLVGVQRDAAVLSVAEFGESCSLLLHLTFETTRLKKMLAYIYDYTNKSTTPAIFKK